MTCTDEIGLRGNKRPLKESINPAESTKLMVGYKTIGRAQDYFLAPGKR